MFVGLVRGRGWEPPPPPPPRRRPEIPWRAVATLVAVIALFTASASLGGLPGYLALVAAAAIGAWRLDRWSCGRYWSGLREHRS
jgi:hypothetical protein